MKQTNDNGPRSTLDLAENICRRNAANHEGLEAVEWLIAAVLINRRAGQVTSSQPAKKRYNRDKTAER